MSLGVSGIYLDLQHSLNPSAEALRNILTLIILYLQIASSIATDACHVAWRNIEFLRKLDFSSCQSRKLKSQPWPKFRVIKSTHATLSCRYSTKFLVINTIQTLLAQQYPPFLSPQPKSSLRLSGVRQCTEADQSAFHFPLQPVWLKPDIPLWPRAEARCVCTVEPSIQACLHKED